MSYIRLKQKNLYIGIRVDSFILYKLKLLKDRAKIKVIKIIRSRITRMLMTTFTESISRDKIISNFKHGEKYKIYKIKKNYSNKLQEPTPELFIQSSLKAI